MSDLHIRVAGDAAAFWIKWTDVSRVYLLINREITHVLYLPSLV